MIESVLVKNAEIVNPEDASRCAGDILVEHGVVTVVAEKIAERNCGCVIDAAGCFVTPGWVDAHAHLYYDYGCIGIDPQQYQLPKGVTYGLDQGTAGADNYGHYREYVLFNTDMRVKNFLNISRIGMPLVSFELLDYSNLDRGAFSAVCRKYPDEIAGIKLRITERMCTGNARNALTAARELADELRLPIFLHATDCVMPTEEILALLRAGDTFTHSFARTSSGILDENGKVRGGVLEARKRGVLFDTGHGVASLSFAILERALSEGFYPDTISTDLHTVNIKSPVIDLPTTLSKFLHYGLSLDEALTRVTVNPVRQYGLSDKSLRVKAGERADFAVWRLERGKFSYYDCEGACINADRRVAPLYTVLGRKVFTPRKVW